MLYLSPPPVPLQNPSRFVSDGIHLFTELYVLMAIPEGVRNVHPLTTVMSYVKLTNVHLYEVLSPFYPFFNF